MGNTNSCSGCGSACNSLFICFSPATIWPKPCSIFATGFLTLSYFNKLTNSLMSSYDANKALLLYPIVKQYSVIISRLILVSLTYLIIQFLFYGSLIILGLAAPPSDILLLIYANLIIALLGLGIGLLNLCLILVWDSWKFIWQILNRPLFFISGVFFIPSLLSDNFCSI